MSNDSSLINKYRPLDFVQMFGNELVIKNLMETLVSTSKPHTFLFTGPSGTGKTTLARIICKYLNASLYEVDAASNSGVDAMRALVASAGFTPITTEPNRFIFIDECHALSPNAWKAALKLLEEPPACIYIGLSTTELTKIPDNIRTRCYHVALKTLKPDQIGDLIEIVAELEGWKVVPEVLTGMIQASTGQPRKALTILQAGHTAATKEQLAEVVAEVELDSDPLNELCRFLVSGGKDWKRIKDMLARVDPDIDSVAQASKWLLTVMLRSEEEAAYKAWVLLDAIQFPRAGFDNKSKLVAAIGALLWTK